jgi:hypothetical protein
MAAPRACQPETRDKIVAALKRHGVELLPETDEHGARRAVEPSTRTAVAELAIRGRATSGDLTFPVVARHAPDSWFRDRRRTFCGVARQAPAARGQSTRTRH